MEDKSQIDKKRASSGWINIGTEEDGAILQMFNINEKHLIIKEKAIYELITADKVDPERKNIGLPNMIHRLVFGQGLQSAMVSKIFLTAKTLFAPQFFDDTIDVNSAVILSLEALKEFGDLEKNINDYLSCEKSEIEAYEKRKNDGNTSYALPAITDIETRCKTIFQKADHIEQILMEIIILFFPNEGLIKQSHYPKFQEIIKNKFGEGDPFYLFLEKVILFMRVVREFRNALDHRLNFIKIRDFDIQVDGTVLTPTVEFKHDDILVTRQALSGFLQLTLKTMIYVFETTMAHVGAKKVKKDFLNYQLREIPVAERHNKHVRFAFWSTLGGLEFFH